MIIEILKELSQKANMVEELLLFGMKEHTCRQAEKMLLSQLRKGKLVFTLVGHKLKGEYALVKSSYQGENSWLLMKVKDKFAKTADITKKDKSVVSGKWIKQMEK